MTKSQYIIQERQKVVIKTSLWSGLPPRRTWSGLGSGKRVAKILDSTHSGQKLFGPLPASRSYRVLFTHKKSTVTGSLSDTLNRLSRAKSCLWALINLIFFCKKNNVYVYICFIYNIYIPRYCFISVCKISVLREKWKQSQIPFLCEST